MDFYLFNSPIYSKSHEIEEEYLPPLGLVYIATQLKKSNIQTRVIDCVQKRLGICDIQGIIEKEHPDYVGFNLFSINYGAMKGLIESIKVKTTIFLGGQIIRSEYNEIIKWETENNLILVIGEAELIVPDIVNNNCTESPILKNGRKQVYRVDMNSKYFPSDLDLEQLDRTFLGDYAEKSPDGRREISIITSRGCPFRCAYCGGAWQNNLKSRIRTRSWASIENEIDSILVGNPDISSIRILDDLFLRDEKSIIEATKLFNKFPFLSWRAMAHVKSFERNTSLLTGLKACGCQELFIGVESGSDRVRDFIHKEGSVDLVKSIIHSILQSGISVKCYFIYGFPTETKEDAEATYQLAKELVNFSIREKVKFRTSVFKFRPYHGTELFNYLLDHEFSIPQMVYDESLEWIEGRGQFSFTSGNYSAMDIETLNKYYLDTQKLGN